MAAAGRVAALVGLTATGVKVASCGAGGRVGAGNVGLGRMIVVEDGCGAAGGEALRLSSEKANTRLPMINPIETSAKKIPPAISFKLRIFYPPEFLAASRVAMGSKTLKIEPLPISVSTQIRPP